MPRQSDGTDAGRGRCDNRLIANVFSTVMLFDAELAPHKMPHAWWYPPNTSLERYKYARHVSISELGHIPSRRAFIRAGHGSRLASPQQFMFELPAYTSRQLATDSVAVA